MIVIAMPDELSLVGETDEDILITGVGAENVIESLVGYDRSMPIHNIGYAGSNCLPIGTRVEVGKVTMYHPHVSYRGKSYDLGGEVPCYTSSDFVLETKVEDPCVFDMELAYILALGFTNVRSTKVVSDNLSVEEFENVRKG